MIRESVNNASFVIPEVYVGMRRRKGMMILDVLKKLGFRKIQDEVESN